MFHEFNGTIFKQFTKPNSTTNKSLPVLQTELENSKKKLGQNPPLLYEWLKLCEYTFYIYFCIQTFKRKNRQSPSFSLLHYCYLQFSVSLVVEF